jgi:hypothetical protein
MPSKQDRGRAQASPLRPGRRRGALARSATVAGALAAVALTPAAAAAARPAHRHGKAGLSQTFIKEEAHLHLSQKNGSSAIVEQGSATGTFSGSLSAQLTVKISTVTGSVVGYLKGGVISGTVSATPHVSGKYVSFKGTFKLSHGTGRYAGASGIAGFYGVINRETYNATVQLVGRLRM